MCPRETHHRFYDDHCFPVVVGRSVVSGRSISSGRVSRCETKGTSTSGDSRRKSHYSHFRSRTDWSSRTTTGRSGTWTHSLPRKTNRPYPVRGRDTNCHGGLTPLLEDFCFCFLFLVSLQPVSRGLPGLPLVSSSLGHTQQLFFSRDQSRSEILVVSSSVPPTNPPSRRVVLWGPQNTSLGPLHWWTALRHPDSTSLHPDFPNPSLPGLHLSPLGHQRSGVPPHPARHYSSANRDRSDCVCHFTTHSLCLDCRRTVRRVPSFRPRPSAPPALTPSPLTSVHLFRTYLGPRPIPDLLLSLFRPPGSGSKVPSRGPSYSPP